MVPRALLTPLVDSFFIDPSDVSITTIGLAALAEPAMNPATARARGTSFIGRTPRCEIRLSFSRRQLFKLQTLFDVLDHFGVGGAHALDKLLGFGLRTRERVANDR